MAKVMVGTVGQHQPQPGTWLVRMSIKYISGINERLTRYLTRTIYVYNRRNVTMMGKYDINGQLEM